MQKIFESSLFIFVTYPFKVIFNMLSFFNFFRLVGNSKYKYKEPDLTCVLSSERIKIIEEEVKVMMKDIFEQNQDFSENPIMYLHSDKDIS